MKLTQDFVCLDGGNGGGHRGATDGEATCRPDRGFEQTAGVRMPGQSGRRGPDLPTPRTEPDH